LIAFPTEVKDIPCVPLPSIIIASMTGQIAGSSDTHSTR